MADLKGPITSIKHDWHGRDVYRVRLFDGFGNCRTVTFPQAGLPGTAKDQGLAFVARMNAERSAKARTVAGALEEYLEHLARHGGERNRPIKSRDQYRSMLESLLALRDPKLRLLNRGRREGNKVEVPLMDRPLPTLTANEARRLYRARVYGTTTTGKPISPATHHSELDKARRFGAWLVTRGYAKENPFADIIPEYALDATGTPATMPRGKAHLRIDEARRFVKAAYSDDHWCLGVAAAAILTLGLRANELLERTVRDLDDNDTELVIDWGKSKSSSRRVALPPMVRSELVRLKRRAMERDPMLGEKAKLFGTTTDGTLLKYIAGDPAKEIVGLCERAGVPRVVTHGLRGTQIDLTMDVDKMVKKASESAGHADVQVTRRHYLSWSVEKSARARMMEDTLFSESDEEAQRQAEIEALEKQEREAQERLAKLRAGNTPRGTSLKGTSPTNTN